VVPGVGGVLLVQRTAHEEAPPAGLHDTSFCYENGEGLRLEPALRVATHPPNPIDAMSPRTSRRSVTRFFPSGSKSYTTPYYLSNKKCIIWT
jgi:hypothetical protein